MYAEDELLPISALQHLLFCERRVGLIFLERQWQDNIFTAEGSLLHRQTDRAETELRNDVRIVRGLWLKSLRLGLYGRADVVEFKRTDGNDKRQAIKLAGAEGLWIPFPVEYKRGRLRTEKSFEIQLCAQALCLEEMLGIQVSTGALYYGKTRRRLELTLDKAVREKTEIAARRLHEIMDSGNTPDARRQPKCKHCSLNGLCLPKVVSHGSSASHYLKQVPTDPKVIA